jgi:hypothetical protein
MLGSDVLMIQSTPNFASFHISSNSGGSSTSRQYYSNHFRLIRTPDQRNRNVTLFSYEFTKQVIKGLVPTPQGGIDVAITPKAKLLVKFDFSRNLFMS